MIDDRRMLARPKTLTGFTIAEIVAVVLVLAVLVGLLLPAVQSSREAARRMSCGNNFRQIGLAIHQYHDAYGRFPMQATGTGWDPATPGMNAMSRRTSQQRLSWIVGVLPFVGQQDLWETISNPLTTGGSSTPSKPYTWPAMGPKPNPGSRAYRPHQLEPTPFRCPSDPGFGQPSAGRTNYAACTGDAISQRDQFGPVDPQGRPSQIAAAETAAEMRGVFVPYQRTRYRDVTDGLAHTMAGGELATDLGDDDIRTTPSYNNTFAALRDNPSHCRDAGQIDQARRNHWNTNAATPTRVFGLTAFSAGHGRGFSWASADNLFTSCKTILSPNRELCMHPAQPYGSGTLTISSRHPMGAHVLMVDGVVRFISDQIDAGNNRAGSVRHDGTGPVAPESESPYGVFGAMGTRAGQEIVQSAE